MLCITNILLIIVAKVTSYEIILSEVNTYFDSCFNTTSDDDLPRLDKESVPPNSIMLVEPSCADHLEFKQACAVEYAASAQSKRKVYVLFTGPVDKQLLKLKHIAIIQKHFDNVEFKRLFMSEAVIDTPIEEFLENTNKSDWHHYSNIIFKHLVFHKFGGVFADLNEVVNKTFGDIIKAQSKQYSSKYTKVFAHNIEEKTLERFCPKIVEKFVKDMTKTTQLKRSKQNLLDDIELNRGKQVRGKKEITLEHNNNKLYPKLYKINDWNVKSRVLRFRRRPHQFETFREMY